MRLTTTIAAAATAALMATGAHAQDIAVTDLGILNYGRKKEETELGTCLKGLILSLCSRFSLYL